MLSGFLVLVGVVLLYIGGEVLVKHSVILAKLWGLSPLVIGLTIVALGTSSPELAASLVAAFRGSAEMAVGNIVGSNIANIGMILGVSAIIVVLHTQRQFLLREMPYMLFTSALILPLFWDNTLGRIEGGILLFLLVLFLGWLLRYGSDAPLPDEVVEAEAAPGSGLFSMGGIALGIALLTGGAYSMVEGASEIARGLGVSERVIGLTVVAFGTSLPELASCGVAAWRREADIVLGNVIGSNIMNVLCILGATAVIQPLTIARGDLMVDYIIMMAFSLLLWGFLFTNHQLRRMEGSALLGIYIGYIVYLFVSSSPSGSSLPI